MHRHLCLAVVAFVVIVPLTLVQGQQPKPERLPEPRLDAHGDPLPAAAIGRLGTLRFRHRNQSLAGLTLDGKSLVLFGRTGLQVMDADTGKITERSQANHSPPSRYGFSGGPSRGPIANLIFPERGGGGFTMFSLDLVHFEGCISGGKTVLLHESSEDFDFSVFDSESGKRVQKFRTADFTDGNEGLKLLALNRDGNFILAHTLQPKNGGMIEGVPGKLRCFEVASKQLKYEIDAPKKGSIRTLTISDDGNILLFVAMNNAGKGELQLWDIAKGTPIRKFELNPDHATRLQLTGDGKHLFAVNKDASIVRQLDAMAGTEIRPLALAKERIQSFLASPDGKHLFVVTPEGIEQWDVPKAQKVRTLGRGYGDKRLALSPGGDRLYFVGDTAITIWDTATGKELPSHLGHRATVWAVTFSPDGRKILTSSGDGTARLWNTTSREHLGEFGSAGKPNQRWYGAEPFAHAPFVQAGFCSNGQRIITVWPQSPVEVWDVATGKKRAKLGLETKDGSVALACSPRDNLVATVAPDGRIRMWDVLHGEQRMEFQWRPNNQGDEHLNVAAAAFAPSGSTLAVAGLQPPRNTLKLFETSTLKQRFHLDLVGKLQPDLGEVPALVLAQRFVAKVAYSGDGKVLALGGVHSIHLLDATTLKERLVLGGMNTFGPSVSLSADGTLAAAGTLDGVVRIWDAKSGRLLSEAKGHEYFITATAFSPDGKMLATASNDSTVLLWDVAQLLQQKALPRVFAQTALDQLWSDLASSDAAEAFRAVGELARAPAEAPGYLKDRLQAVPLPDPKRIDELVTNLNSGQYAVRQKASLELEKLAELAVPALRSQLTNKPSLEMHQRIRLLLQKINGPATNPEFVRAVRAVEVLESIGTPDAQAVLEVLTKGAPTHRLTQSAEAALKRLKVR
jgi:WD40 repeat protein